MQTTNKQTHIDRKRTEMHHKQIHNLCGLVHSYTLTRKEQTKKTEKANTNKKANPLFGTFCGTCLSEVAQGGAVVALLLEHPFWLQPFTAIWKMVRKC